MDVEDSRGNVHAADGSFLGYLVQVERALYWLSVSQSDAVIGIEVEDDVSVKLGSGLGIREIYEQAKNTVNSNAPYSDNSEDLWKTLSIWVAAVLEKRIAIDTARFSVFSNRPIPKTRLIYKISIASELKEQELNECVKKVKDVAIKLRAGLKKYGDIIVNCPDNILSKVISRVEILDVTYNHDSKSFAEQLKSNLHIPDTFPVGHIIEKLSGFVLRQLTESWRNKRECWITEASFNKEVTQVLTDYNRKSFLEKTIDLLPINSKEVEGSKAKKYVEQLKLIRCKEEEILEAVYDYIRATSEKNRFAKDGELTVDKFDEFYADLKNNWQLISRPKFRYANETEHEKVGYEVYCESLKYKGKLNDFEPVQIYTYKGAYHFMADELSIGWHPNWLTLLTD